MIPSITSTSNKSKKTKQVIFKISAIAFWIIVWEALALAIGSDLIISSPVQVAGRLAKLIVSPDTWKTVGFSFVRIASGFVLALALGTAAAVLSSKVKALKILLSPITSVIKSTPVASFIILAIMWFGSKNLSIFISFLMVFPIIYLNILGGIESVSRELKEMSAVYKLSAAKRLGYVYLPQVMPFVISACSVALGLCWKSGVAAEVIGISDGSIGERLYQAKLYFETGDLLAWTAIIIAVSTCPEKIVLLLLKRLGAFYRYKFSGARMLSDKKHAGMPSKAASDAKDYPVGISLERVSKSFEGQQVLCDYSLEIAAGEHVALMGHSGAGKTTLSRLIMGLESADSGNVKLSGGASFGVVFQEDRLMEQINAMGNIVIAGADPHEAKALLEEFGFNSELMFKPCMELSGGEKRRVAIARALLCRSNVVIFDEPFKGIDDRTLYDAIIPRVKELSDGKTFVLITHSREEAQMLCTRIEQINE